MKCPACKKSLREKSVGEFTVDMCFGGCGGIWFDATELERVSARAAAALHTVWQPTHRNVRATDPDAPRACPRCPDQPLDRKWFSDAQQVEIDQCPKCGGLWLDDGEFTSIYDEIKRAQAGAPAWAPALADAVQRVKSDPGPTLET